MLVQYLTIGLTLKFDYFAFMILMKYIAPFLTFYGQLFILSLLISINASAQNHDTIQTAHKSNDSLIQYVNPFIGTGGHGHTYPGATMPFGMMQLSPDTRLEGWDGCSGYHYSDNYIYGFSHTHLSGTGVSDYGDILLMPTNKVIFNNGANGEKGYRAHFSHKNEIASPGYYEVLLDSTNIQVALTVTQRAGIHQYTFPKGEKQIVILDLEHRDAVLDHQINLLSDSTVNGYRHSKAWAEKQLLYYHIEFSKPFIQKEQTDNGQKMAFEFDATNSESLFIRIGISAVDKEGAKLNLTNEIGNQSFADIKQQAETAWENQMQKIVIETNNYDYKVNFYTALYHTMLAPNIYQDVDGRYRGMDLNIHQTNEFDYYTVFSLWDTYRAAHPLYTIIEQDRTNDFINTFIAKYEEGGIMPIWDLSACYTHCMIGYHAVPVIADAYLKGIQDYDALKAFEAMKHSANQDKLGLKSYKTMGYIPVEQEGESVSKTLEYAYDDWTIAQMAKALNKAAEVKIFTQRAQYYKNVFDPSSNFMRGRIRNTWFQPFDPFEVNFNYTEANAWQYSFYVPQDVSGFIDLLGGKNILEKQLDDLFNASSQTTGANQVDVTGLIGQYAHGNEPSHHIAYLYNFINIPHKTQEKVHEILTTMYSNAPDGISGNEDCGQMSAWYVLSSLGFYPVTPGYNTYIIGKPLFDKATIHLENGKQFVIEAYQLNEENIYIESAKLNDQAYPFSYLKHEDIMKGGQLTFTMTDTPSDWGTQDAHIPSTEITKHLIVPAPYIAKGDIAFKEKTTLVLENTLAEADIYYSLGDGDFKKYDHPFSITEPVTLQTYAQLGDEKSPVISTDFHLINTNLSIQLESDYANRYNGGGDEALINGMRGTLDYRSGTWQGYYDTDLIATVDLGKRQKIKQVSIGFLQDQRSWIFYPNQVEFWTSKDGVQWQALEESTYTYLPEADDEPQILQVQANQFSKKIRYLKIKAKTIGDLPEWHIGHAHEGKTWIFVDEIVIK